ncbi:hypothetical protein OG203_30900 [Nocardia sp. NBC_01499]|uniref:hypothetical protein n=1 Tax=Nocardia sp. NBC_01499 TaxID=2903597 RepID=UPI00386FFCAA
MPSSRILLPNVRSPNIAALLACCNGKDLAALLLAYDGGPIFGDQCRPHTRTSG